MRGIRKGGSQADRTTISKDRPYELQYWAKKFNVSPQQLKQVIDVCGTERLKVIEKYIVTHQ